MPELLFCAGSLPTRVMSAAGLQGSPVQGMGQARCRTCARQPYSYIDCIPPNRQPFNTEPDCILGMLPQQVVAFHATPHACRRAFVA